MLQPVRRRTWAPRGVTPIQYAWDRHDRLSVIGAVSISPVRHRTGLYFQVLPHNIHTEDVVWFLTQMHRYFGGRIILVWDRWSVHRAAACQFETKHPGWFDFEWLPSYAPDLNPVEWCWNHTKYTDMANFVPENLDSLHNAISTSVTQQSENKRLVKSFFAGAKLRL
jgi:transposase